MFKLILYCFLQPDIIVHSAAERRPDVVEKQENATKLLNVESTQFICEEAGNILCYRYITLNN